MEEPKPKNRMWSYQSLRYILGFMDSNFRIQLALQIPDIRSIIACLPLKIDYLKLDTTSTTINHLKFTLSVYREYLNERPPLEVNGKVEHDLDEFGLRFHPEMTPGDVVLCEIAPVIVSKSEINNQLSHCAKRLRRFLEFFPREEDEETLANNEGHTIYWRRQLLPFEYQKQGKKSPCKLYLQLEVYNDETSETETFRFPYTMRIPEALKELNSILFGNRKVVCDVERLEIDTPILRLTENGMKMRVAEVEIGGFHVADKPYIRRNINFDALKPLIHESSYPLQSLKFNGQRPFPGMFDSEVLKDITNLTLSREVNILGQPWGPELIKLSALKYFGYHDVEYEDCLRLVRLFQQKQCPPGTSYSFCLHQRQIGGILRRFREHPDKYIDEEDAVIFLMPNRRHCIGVNNNRCDAGDRILEIAVCYIIQDPEENDGFDYEYDYDDDDENDEDDE